LTGCESHQTPRTRVTEPEGFVLKQGGVVVGGELTRKSNRVLPKEQVTVRYSPDVC
jgi:hypothetical protein